HPEQNAYVERFHRTLKQECLQVERPSTAGQTQQALTTFETFYNHERPHQGRALLDRPPAERLRETSSLPALPTAVDPLAWLHHEPQQVFRRRVDAAGRIKLDLKRYYVGKAWRGQLITVHLNAAEATLVLWGEGQILKVLPVPAWSKGALRLRSMCNRSKNRREPNIVFDLCKSGDSGFARLAHPERAGTQGARSDRETRDQLHTAYPKAVANLKAAGVLPEHVALRQVKYLNNLIEQDHRFIKRLTKPGMGFFSFETAWRTLQGFEMMNMLRKGQFQGVAKGDVGGQVALIAKLFGAVA
ncbi:DDE-type integrase/transposase/recombinase, partial [Dictyobacter formicarum]|uniref:DDE-type integrase/transposase/recombinase n=1 Tax=Dictyobacter formicarum TaxID=2778368 RepID=UPI001915545A